MPDESWGRDAVTEIERAQGVVDAWNRDHPAGTPVRYWTGAREGAGREGATRSPAWLLCGSPVVAVTGHAGGVALTHVEVLTKVPDADEVESLRREAECLAERVSAAGTRERERLVAKGEQPGLARLYQDLHQAAVELRAAQRHLADAARLMPCGISDRAG